MPTDAVPPVPPIPVRSVPPPTKAPPPGAPRRWRQLALLGGLLNVDNSESSVQSVLFPALRASLGLPLAALGQLVAASKLAHAVAGPLWVALARRWPRKNVLAMCCGFWGVWTAAMGLAQNFVQLLVLGTIASAGIAGGGPLVNGLVADLFDDADRGRAAGVLYGIAALGLGITGPLLGLLSDVENGWRYGFFASGTVQVVFGVLILAFLRDPGVGARDGARSGPAAVTRLTQAQFRGLLRNRTLLLICVQRLTTGQFILISFGVTFLVDERGFTNATASLVTPAVTVTYLLGTFLGGFVADRVHRRHPRTGRIAAMQTAIVAYAVVAYAATQIDWGPMWVYMVVFGLVGGVQSVNPGINRPVVMSVVLPELRSAAFALMLSVEAAGWAISSLLVGYLGDAFGLQTAFLWLAVVLMLANGALVTLLYRPYVRDAAAVRSELARRAAATIGGAKQA
ncbi:MFS transporter [Streptomyces sp. NBC_01280]|uniref:MFS transporter n=1 Tax=unclassified Streptomyces TaxID=2593676 RepID=UPI002E333F96|nr:MFS transporter [Streptomyces sp. NBC_01280]WSE19097.1 MFS transporter [Streptomyces sp. NBC_01397]